MTQLKQTHAFCFKPCVSSGADRMCSFQNKSNFTRKCFCDGHILCLAVFTKKHSWINLSYLLSQNSIITSHLESSMISLSWSFFWYNFIFSVLTCSFIFALVIHSSAWVLSGWKPIQLAKPMLLPSFSSKVSVTWKEIQSTQIVKELLKKGFIRSCLWTSLQNICCWHFPEGQKWSFHTNRINKSEENIFKPSSHFSRACFWCFYCTHLWLAAQWKSVSANTPESKC